MSASDGVLVTRPAPGVTRLALNRPEQRNALTQDLAQAFREQVAAVAGDPAVRALIVAGEGRSFCAGADLGALGADATTVAAKRRVLSDYYHAFLDLRDLELPTIAAVNGAAVGAGLNLALCCDLRLLADDARLGAPFTRLGIHPGGGNTWMLTHLAGPAAARELLLLGEPLASERALALGLASRVVGREELETAALEWAVHLASLPRPLLVSLKRTLRLAEAGGSWDEVMDFETTAQAESLLSNDAQEGWLAFKERRPPRFEDR
ncbi:MAG: enoyl-CoA hydratase/isomerase family protein [Candidatus Dormibacteria bacterium]